MSDWADVKAESVRQNVIAQYGYNCTEWHVRAIAQALRDVQGETVEKCCDEVCLRCSRGEVAERLAGGWVHAVTGGSVECKAWKIRERFMVEGNDI